MATATQDNLFFYGYRISFLIVILIGMVGLGAIFAFFNVLDVTFDLLTPEVLVVILPTLVALFIACLIIGWFQVVFVSKIGEEIILLVWWLTPFLVAGVSLFLFYVTDYDFNYLGGLAVAVIFFVFSIWQRKKIRLSSRLVELGAEIVTHNLKMFIPAISCMTLKFIATICMLTGAVLIISLAMVIPGIVGIIVAIILLILFFLLYLFVIQAINAFAEAVNLDIVHQWYTTPKKSPDLGEARRNIKELRGAIARYALLVTFVAPFRPKRSAGGWTPGSLFKWMKFSDWPRLINDMLSGRGVSKAVTKVVEYLGYYTLVIIVAKRMNSVTQAIKGSVQGAFSSFLTMICGDIGLNIVEKIRSILTSLLLLVLGAIYGFIYFPVLVNLSSGSGELFGFANLLYAIIFAIIFLIVGSIPVSSLFRPVYGSYQYVLYQTLCEKKISSRLDKQTVEIIKGVYSKK